MIINRNNYQVWITDYYDGQLDDMQVKYLMEFLSKNPDLKDEFDDLPGLNLQAENIDSGLKNSLFKFTNDLSTDQIDNYLIAMVEGDLDENQEAELNFTVNKSPELKSRLEEFRKTKLVPPVIVYPRKAGLKRIPSRRKLAGLLAYSISAAASVLILIGFISVFTKSNSFSDHNSFLALSDETTLIEAGSEDLTASRYESSDEKHTVTDAEATGPDRDNTSTETTGMNRDNTSTETTGMNRTDSNAEITGTIRDSYENVNSNRERLVTSEIRANHKDEESNINFGQSSAAESVTSQIAKVSAGTTETREIIEITPASISPDIILPVVQSGYMLAEVSPVSEIRQIDISSLTPREFLAMQVRKNLLKEENPDSDNLKLHEYAGMGVKGVNALLGWDMKLETSKDDEGRLDHLKFTSQLINYDSKADK